MKKTKKDGFVMLPRWLFETTELNGKDKMFCLILAYHRNSHTKLCCPSIPKLVTRLDLHRQTVFKIRKKIVKLGLINYQAGLGRKHYAKYNLNWLDGSDIEIARLKEILKSKEVVEKRPPLSGRKGEPELNLKELDSLNKDKQRLTEIKRPSRSGRKGEPGKWSKREPLTTKNLNNNKKKQQQEGLAAVSSSHFSEGKNQIRIWFTDTGWRTLSGKKIEELINIAIAKGKVDMLEYFRLWKKAIDKKKSVYNKPGYLIKMVKAGENPPKYSIEEEGGRIL